jgi:hypothetical protein
MSTAVQAEVKERPIIFGADSVKSIFAGHKTQTRRVMKPQAEFRSVDFGIGPDRWQKVWMFDPGPKVDFRLSIGDPRVLNYCPYGEVGGHLWVREAWGDVTGAFQSHECEDPQVWAYRADEAVHNSNAFLEHMSDSGIVCNRWRSPIFMPRWMSRLTLEITNVRVERLKEITEGDVEAEGVRPSNPACGVTCARDLFKQVWDWLNAKRGFGWDKNPWVWVIEFKRK